MRGTLDLTSFHNIYFHTSDFLLRESRSPANEVVLSVHGRDGQIKHHIIKYLGERFAINAIDFPEQLATFEQVIRYNNAGIKKAFFTLL